MAKVHPNAAAAAPEHVATAAAAAAATPEAEGEAAAVLTVWRKSLLFNCDGFTVYDAAGALAFRVDRYAGSRRRGADVVLMDAAGRPLLTVRRAARLGVPGRRWLIFDGDAGDGSTGSAPTPLLSVRRHAAAGRRLGGGARKTLASASAAAPLLAGRGAAAAEYVVEGSYGARACAVRDAARGGAVVAEVRRKEQVGDDVFRLVVAGGPRLGAPLAMALVIALDDMFRGGAADGAGGWSSAARSLLRKTLSV